MKRWLQRHRRFHLHYIPTRSSWLNMIERWFRHITDKALRRGVFQSVPSLIQAIRQDLDAHNTHPRIFTWTKDADTILAKIAKCKEALGTLHQRFESPSPTGHRPTIIAPWAPTRRPVPQTADGNCSTLTR